jgi:hypothetical protein
VGQRAHCAHRRLHAPTPNTADVSRTDKSDGAKTSPQPTPSSVRPGPLSSLSSFATTRHANQTTRRASIDPAQITDSIVPATVSILGFKSNLTLPLKHPINPPHPYRITGHVGYSLDGGKTIFGFGPSNLENVSSADTLDRLFMEETFPGKVTDDTHVFRSVAENPTHPASTASEPQYVYKQDIPVSQKKFASIKAAHNARPLNEPMPEIRYGFPLPNTTAFNCATYPASLATDCGFR